jgi:hypothetical protein
VNLVGEIFCWKFFLYLSVFDCQKQDCVDYGDPLILYTGATVYNKNKTILNITVNLVLLYYNKRTDNVSLHLVLFYSYMKKQGGGYKQH